MWQACSADVYKIWLLDLMLQTNWRNKIELATIEDDDDDSDDGGAFHQ